MKRIGASVVIGVILSFGVIYILRPLNAGAVTLVVILCVGVCGTIGGFLAATLKKKS
jgi:hypothetical protein